MFRKSVFLAVLIGFICILFSGQANAQGNFGKNRVQYRKLNWVVYDTPHFKIRHYFDLKDPMQAGNMKKLVGLLESQYRFYSSFEVFDLELSERLNVIVFETHSDLEGSPLSDPFLPEGVGAFVEWARIRMIIKEDFEPQLFERIVAHELVHQFQMKIIQKNLLGKILGKLNVPNGFIEGGAEYLTGLRLPHTRGDIRDDQMRAMAADIHTMPPWEALMSDQANGYVAWKMVFDFLDAEFGLGTGVKFQVQGLRNKDGLGSLLYNLSKGRLGNPDINSDLFNQEFFDHYTEFYEADRISRPKPYQETANFKGRNITPSEHPYPMLCQALSPDGKRMACFTIQKYGVALVTFKIPEVPIYVDNSAEQRKKKRDAKFEKVVINLTPQMVPIPYEYLISQFETWPRNGSHIDWSSDNRIAFFARTGRDHMLYIVDPDKEGKILDRIPLDVDQGFSPKFSPDNKKIYFSATSHSIADLYVIDLDTKKVTNLTKDERYDTGPDVSPDGTKIVYVGNDGDFTHLFMLDLNDGSKKQITFGRYNDIEPSWSDSGNTIAFVSDEKDKVFYPYTLDVATNTRSLRLTLFGGTNNPMFARNSEDTIYYTVSRPNDTFHGQIYWNAEVFEAKLKVPVSTESIIDKQESNIYSFNSDKFLEVQLDPNQVNNPRKPSEDWKFEASDITLSSNSWYGVFASSSIYFSNMMETKHHMFQFATFSSYFRVFNYTYVDMGSRFTKALSVNFNRYPLYILYYDATEQRPKGSALLNIAYWQDYGTTAAAHYPMSKWTRVEMFTGFRNIKYDLQGITPELFELMGAPLNDNDKQLYSIMNASSGSSLFGGVAIVRDTVVSSGYAQGPLHGNAFRAEFVAAPPMGKNLKGYMSVSGEARIYRRLGRGTLVAIRGDAKTTNRESGEIIVAGGSDRFRGKEWGSIIGNQIAYGSVELRFPVIDGLVFPGGFGIGPFRGLLFADAGITKFRGENFPARKIFTYGAGIEFKPFQIVWTRQPNGKFTSSFYYTIGW